MSVRVTFNAKTTLASFRKAVDGRMDAALKVIEDEAKRGCPVETGKLRDSSHREHDAGSLAGKIVFDAPYAKYVEFGTRLQLPNPFLRRALYAKADEALRILAGGKP